MQISAVIYQLLVLPLALTASVPRQKPQTPTVVIVPGAWHSPQHYTELRDYLGGAGYTTVSQRNPSCNSTDPNAESAAKDAKFIRDQVLLPLLDSGKVVVLVMHSYGGLPGATAAKGLSQTERHAAGQPGGIVGLIFISAILAHDGQSLLSLLPEQKFDPWVLQENNGQLDVANPKQVFYGLVPQFLAQLAITLIRPQSRASLSTPGGPPAWLDPAFDNRRSYWLSLNDHSIPPQAQEAMLNGSTVQWHIERFPSDHSSFLSFPLALSSWVIREIRSWQGVTNGTSVGFSSNLTAIESDFLMES